MRLPARMSGRKVSGVQVNKFTPFWLVWSPTGKTSPSKRHDLKEEAAAEAERLARANPGAEFYVLEPHACCKKSDVQWTLAAGHSGEDIPF